MNSKTAQLPMLPIVLNQLKAIRQGTITAFFQDIIMYYKVQLTNEVFQKNIYPKIINDLCRD